MLLTVVAIALALAPRPSLGQKRCELGTIPQRDFFSRPADVAPASLSSDGRFLALASRMRLSPVDTNGNSDIYVVDRSTGQLTIETLMPDGRASAGDSLHPRISGDGHMLVFDSGALLARNGIPGPGHQVLLRDRRLGTTKVLSKTHAGGLGNGHSTNAVISAQTVAWSRSSRARPIWFQISMPTAS
jgi:hypothetical protein